MRQSERGRVCASLPFEQSSVSVRRVKQTREADASKLPIAGVESVRGNPLFLSFFFSSPLLHTLLTRVRVDRHINYTS